MLTRRPLIAAAFAFATVRPALAERGAWAGLYGEFRIGSSERLDDSVLRRVAGRTGVPTVGMTSGRQGLVAALDAGHLEAAIVNPPMLDAVLGRMGDRIVVRWSDAGSVILVRRALPDALRTDLQRALSDTVA